MTEKEITLSPGTESSPFRKEVPFEVKVPDEVGEYLYQFNIVSSNLNQTLFHVTRFSIDTRPDFSIIQSSQGLLEYEIILPKPVFGITKIRLILLLVAIFIGLVAAGIIYQLFKTKKKY